MHVVWEGFCLQWGKWACLLADWPLSVVQEPNARVWLKRRHCRKQSVLVTKCPVGSLIDLQERSSGRGQWMSQTSSTCIEFTCVPATSIDEWQPKHDTFVILLWCDKQSGTLNYNIYYNLLNCNSYLNSGKININWRFDVYYFRYNFLLMIY